MVEEDRLLLVKDLSARLPYGVEVEHIKSGMRSVLHEILVYPMYDDNDNVFDCICYTDFFGDNDNFSITAFKPYLFPLSSMTEKQKEELRQMDAFINTFGQICFSTYDDYGHELMPTHEDAIRIINWCNKNHFDYRGLIPKDLALDATGKNIY